MRLALAFHGELSAGWPAIRVGVRQNRNSLARAQALLNSSAEGRAAYIHADLRDPVSILDDPVTSASAVTGQLVVYTVP